MADTVTVEGDTRLAATLAAASASLAQPEAEAVSGRLVASRARSRAPVLSGRLAGSVSADGGTVTARLPYAAVTEYGGGNNIPAQPYMRPSLTESKEMIVETYRLEMQATLGRVKGA